MVHLHATCDHQAVATKLHSARPFRCCQETVIPGTYGVKYGRGRWLEPKLPRESHGIFTKFAVCFPAITQKMEVSNIILKLSDERPFHLSFGGKAMIQFQDCIYFVYVPDPWMEFTASPLRDRRILDYKKKARW